jgi:hypothetical protein
MSERTRKTLIHLKSPVARIALLLLENEVERARLQFRRIRKNSGVIDTYMRLLAEKGVMVAHGIDPQSAPDHEREMNEAQLALFADIHFLLICLDKVDLMLKTLERNLPDNQALKFVRQGHATALRNYNDFRNHLEHIDDRLKRNVSDLGNFGNNIFTFDEKDFNVGLACEKELEEIFNEALRALEE